MTAVGGSASHMETGGDYCTEYGAWTCVIVKPGLQHVERKRVADFSSFAERLRHSCLQLPHAGPGVSSIIAPSLLKIFRRIIDCSFFRSFGDIKLPVKTSPHFNNTVVETVKYPLF